MCDSTKHWTSLVFKWSKVIRSPNGLVFECHFNKELPFEHRTRQKFVIQVFVNQIPTVCTIIFLPSFSVLQSGGPHATVSQPVLALANYFWQLKTCLTRNHAHHITGSCKFNWKKESTYPLIWCQRICLYIKSYSPSKVAMEWCNIPLIFHLTRTKNH